MTADKWAKWLKINKDEGDVQITQLPSDDAFPANMMRVRADSKKLGVYAVYGIKDYMLDDPGFSAHKHAWNVLRAVRGT